MGLSQIYLGNLSLLRSFPHALVQVIRNSQGLSFHFLMSLVTLGIVFGMTFFLVQKKASLSPLPLKVYSYFLVALGMIIVSYPLNLTVTADRLSGVYTRVHMGASVGFAWLWGILIYGGVSFCQHKILKKVFIITVSVFIFILVNFGIVIQQDYARNWLYQKQFWQNLVPLITDAEAGDIILVDGNNLNYISTEQMRGNDWNTPPILGNLFRFPDAKLMPPRVYMLTRDWQDHLFNHQGGITMTPAAIAASPDHLPVPNRFDPKELNRVILIESRNNQLYRLPRVNSNEQEIFFKAPSKPILNTLDRNILYQYLID